MLNPELFLSFLTVSFLLAVTPGPSNAFLMAQVFAKGKKAGIQTALGFAAAGVIHTLLMVIGLSALLKTSPNLYQAVLWAGAIYLIYLGIMTIGGTFKKQKMASEDKQHVSNKKEKNVLIQAMLTELLNPKVALFFIAFIPQFVDASLETSVTVQLFLFGIFYPIFALPIDLTYIHFGDKIAGYFRSNQNVEVWMDRTAGTIFIVLAANMLLN